jgi:urea carboxylase
MFAKVLIANRGAIACRVIRTLKKMGIKSVAVYSEADSDSLHVQQADEAYSLGEGAAAQTYLDQDKLFAIVQKAGAQAIHPGYGFLSENAGFARRCAQEGIAFLGPTPEQMEAFGLKHTARELAEQSGLPLLPGSGLLDTLDSALAAAAAIGYPVMLKSTAGGGGIGMQLCWSADELHAAYDSVRRLGANNFSNNGVFLEKYVANARHIEVQIFGDGNGNALALGERDCSTQRRNQKVIEETPAPNLPDTVRSQLQRVSVQLAGSVKYRSAGTIEFIYDPQAQAVYFLEVNTRLQVEHGVTEQIYGVDLVEWMIRVGAGELPPLHELKETLQPRGHAIQMRVYAEDPGKNFQPSAGLLSAVAFPHADGCELRIDHWIETGLEVSPYFDPMLAKIIAWAPNREAAIDRLDAALAATGIYGIETNIDYGRAILRSEIFTRGEIHTRYLAGFAYAAPRIDVLMPGTLTTIQDFPGRSGYWDVGVPPSGPFDDYSFRLGNRLLGNDEAAAGLEITLNGPTLKFRTATQIVLAGAPLAARLNGAEVADWQVIDVPADSTLAIGKSAGSGARAYLLVKGGLRCPDYLGSKSTFTLGQFGGHSGRALRAGDVLPIAPLAEPAAPVQLDPALLPTIESRWTIRVIYGPHGAPDFFTADDIAAFFAADWEVHYNSSRTGVRLVGPKPQWARSDGGEAGMHPSNIHDNAYAIGAIDFTGDMPVILGPDGPSLGGFVCPATVIRADRWKMGQLKAGDRVKFMPVSIADAVAMEAAQLQSLRELRAIEVSFTNRIDALPSPIVAQRSGDVEVVYRAAGDKYLLVEYGPQVLDIHLRFRVHALMLALQAARPAGVFELTPGIRSLQIHYDSQQIPLSTLLDWLQTTESQLGDIASLEVPSRVVWLPLSWDDDACRVAIEKYMQSVRKDAPWCPSNIEFIRRINGLDSIDDVKKIVFDASYVVMGLGDVYLGAPVATPLDPRHRLVTTKYNPARTWTAENSVGIGGSYLCVYGMEGPGGYQFVGRTLQMWNRHRTTKEFTQPWLLRFFDQIRFFPVSAAELETIRHDFPRGHYPLRIEQTTFSLRAYQQFLQDEAQSIGAFTQRREAAFAEELQRWIASGQFHFDSQVAADQAEADTDLPAGCVAIDSHVAGNIWQLLVKPGDTIAEGQTIAVLESMKMEIDVVAPIAGTVHAITRVEGSPINAGQALIVVRAAVH